MKATTLVEHAVRTLKAVAPWPVVKAFLKSSGLPASTRGFDELHVKLIEQINSAVDVEAANEVAHKLLNFLDEYHLHGEKRVTLYEVQEHVLSDDGASVADIEDTFLSFENQESDATEAYPFKLLDSDLGLGDSLVTLVSTRQDENSVDLVFSTILAGEIKESYKPESVEAIPEIFQNSEEIIVVRKRATQILPVVTFDRVKKIIQVKVPLLGSFAIEDVIRNNVVNELNQMLRLRLGSRFPGFARSLNVYPAVSKIYLAEDEGKVIELGFVTDTGSAKLERMKSDDLRKELWHGAGKAALQALTTSTLPFTPFRIWVRWAFDENAVDMVLPGTTRTLTSSGITALHHVKISGTVTPQQFNNTISTLLKYVQ